MPAKTTSRWGTVLRLGFYVASVYVGATFFQTGFYWLTQRAFVSAALGTFATALFATFLTIRVFDRRPVADIGLGGAPGSGQNFVVGIVMAAAAAVLVVGLPLLAGKAHFLPREGAGSLGRMALQLFFYLILLMFGAAGEEIIFHGYMFQFLIEKLGAFATILPTALLFGLLHGWNPNVNHIGVMNTVLWGVLLGVAFLRSRDLWLPIGMHWAWNAVLPLFGTNLSGITIEVTRYAYACDLAPLWSGGSYGPEGGLLATVIIVLLFIALLKAPVVPQRAAIAQSLNED